MEIAGYIASFLIGISLGVIGGGGSILTLPVMVYLFGLQPIVATSYSLFIVGSTSLVGALNNLKRGLVNVRAAFLFGATSVITVFLTRKFIVPAIPKEIISTKGFSISESIATMVVFAVLMLVASISMIRSNKESSVVADSKSDQHFFKLFLYGIIIGLITGLLGAGGGFLLIPALVFFLKMPMKKAIGTSLLIIALNSLVGFAGDLGLYSIHWILMLKVTAIAISGIFMGGLISKRVAGEKLEKAFGWFVLVMGIYIIIKESLLK